MSYIALGGEGYDRSRPCALDELDADPDKYRNGPPVQCRAIRGPEEGPTGIANRLCRGEFEIDSLGFVCQISSGVVGRCQEYEG